jgi:four helix bundle protein
LALGEPLLFPERDLRWSDRRQRMARDHRRLRVFNEAHQLVLAIYEETRSFPRDEWFGIRTQVRRAAVSITSNLVEGSARRGAREYVHFVNVSRGSAAEVAYLITLASELGYLSEKARERLTAKCDRLVPQLESLVRKLEVLIKTEDERREEA